MRLSEFKHWVKEQKIKSSPNKEQWTRIMMKMDEIELITSETNVKPYRNYDRYYFGER